MIDNLPEKTGRSLEEWLHILGNHSFEKHSQAVNFLKKEHGVTHGYANTIVHLSKQDDQEDADPLAKQYKGKEHLKPLYDKLIKQVSSFGDDVEVAPKKSYVSLRRKKQFALIQPSTQTRVDLGLNLRDKEPQGALEPSGSFSAMCTHRLRLEQENDITDEVIDWLREAYEQAGS